MGGGNSTYYACLSVCLCACERVYVYACACQNFTVPIDTKSLVTMELGKSNGVSKQRTESSQLKIHKQKGKACTVNSPVHNFQYAFLVAFYLMRLSSAGLSEVDCKYFTGLVA